MRPHQSTARMGPLPVTLWGGKAIWSSIVHGVRKVRLIEGHSRSGPHRHSMIRGKLAGVIKWSRVHIVIMETWHLVRGTSGSVKHSWGKWRSTSCGVLVSGRHPRRRSDVQLLRRSIRGSRQVLSDEGFILIAKVGGKRGRRWR